MATIPSWVLLVRGDSGKNVRALQCLSVGRLILAISPASAGEGPKAFFGFAQSSVSLRLTHGSGLCFAFSEIN